MSDIRAALKESFRQQSRVLIARGQQHAALSGHGTSIGDWREDVVREELNERFPMYKCRRGEIVTPTDGPSSEWDVIITDPSQGAPLAAGPSSVVAAETVRAVISVKSELRTEHVAECARQAVRLRGMFSQTLDRPLPAVYLWAFGGLSPATLCTAMRTASATSGTAGQIDGVLKLGAYWATGVDGEPRVSVVGDDAWAYLLMALQASAESHPQGPPVRLATYLFDDSPEPPSKVSTAPQFDASYVAVGKGPSEILLRLDDRSAGRLSGALLVQRIREDLANAKADKQALVAFDNALSDPDTFARTVAEARGELARALARVLLLSDRSTQALPALRVAADDLPEHRGRLLVAIARVRRAADAAPEEVERLLDEASSAGATETVELERLAERDDHEARLRRLHQLAAPSDRQDRAWLSALMAESLTDLGRDAEALDCAESVLAEGWEPMAAERAAIALLRLSEQQRSDDAKQPQVLDRVRRAVGLLVVLAVELSALGLHDTVLRMDARLAGALVRAGSRRSTAELADWWLDGRLDGRDIEARTALALSLLDCQQFLRAERVAVGVDESTPAARLLSARLAVEGDDASRWAAAVDHLDQLVAASSTDLVVRSGAAVTRLIAAATGRAAWSVEAATLLRGEQPFWADVIEAEYLAERGERAAAEALLLPYAASARGKQALVDVAVQAEDWTRVVALIDALGDAIRHSSSCDVHPHRSGLERWPRPTPPVCVSPRQRTRTLRCVSERRSRTLGR